MNRSNLLAAPLWLTAIVSVLLVAYPATSVAQDATRPTDGMAVDRVEIVGLEALSEAYIRRLIASRAGQPFSRRQVEDDVRELLRTRKFVAAFANTSVENGRAVIVFNVQEKPTLTSVEIVGNKKFAAADLYEFTPVAGAVLDRYELRRSREDILAKYRQAGYYYAEVTLDQKRLEEERRAVFTITEGPRVKVRNIRYEGNRAYGPLRLGRLVDSRTYFWIFRTGAFDEDQAERDAIALQEYYRNNGYLDARVGYRLEFDPIKREDLDLIFVIEEGERYRVREVVFSGNDVFDDEHLRSVMNLGPGEYLRSQVLLEDVRKVRDLYGEIGYVAANIGTNNDFLDTPGEVVLRYTIDEGIRSRFGRITVRGNTKTKDEVIRRALRFYPGEYYNTKKTRRAEIRLRELGFFRPDKVEITPLEDIAGYREALVQVEEAETTKFLIGIGVSTDNGVLGSLTIDNQNFDIKDWPRTPTQFFRGQSFRGDGQRLLFQLEPGTEVSRFRITFTEPYLFDRELRLDSSLYLFQRGREAYDEERLGFTLSLGKRFYGGVMDGWAVEGTARFENITIDNLNDFPPSDIRNERGDHYLSSFRASLVRDTTDSRLLPSEGYRFSMSWEQVGMFGGDHQFSKPAVSLAMYKTVQRDILDRKSILAFRADAAYIIGDAPMFERFYGGGFGSLRGFSFRGISPRKGIFDDPVGGNFILLTGGEYSFPLYGKTFRGVTFIDMGTVEEDFEITSWRMSVGVGVRLQVEFFGPVPIVFDFGFPIAADDEDATQVFNFAFGASF